MDKPGLTVRPQPIENHPDCALVAVEGSIGPGTLATLKTQLQALVTDGTRRFILDCRSLNYINSSGLAYLISLAGEIEPEGGTIALASVDAKILVIFKMMGLLTLFKFYPSSEEALAELRSEEEPSAEAERNGQEAVSEPAPEPAPAASSEPAAPPIPVEPRRPVLVEGSAPRENLIFRLFRRLFRLGEKVG